MRQIVRIAALIASVLALAAATPAAQELVTDSNAVIYEGSRLSYIMAAPFGFALEMAESQVDDYSFAFVSEGDRYSEAEVFVGVTIFSLIDSTDNRGPAEEVIRIDTSGMREHFGETLTIRALDSVVNANGQPLKSFYLEDKTRFIPNVMVAYFDGTEELVIFELIIAPDFPRFVAEETFMEVLANFKVLIQAELTEKSERP